MIEEWARRYFSADSTPDTRDIERRKMLQMAGGTGAAALAGCSTTGNTETETETSTPTDTQTQTETETATETETPEQDLETVGEIVLEQVDEDTQQRALNHFQTIDDELKNTENYQSLSHQLEHLAYHVYPEFDIGKPGIQALQTITYHPDALDLTDEEVILSGRTLNEGGESIPIGAVLTQKEDGYVKDTTYADGTRVERQNGDTTGYLRHNQTPNDPQETGFTRMWDPVFEGTISLLDPENMRGRLIAGDKVGDGITTPKEQMQNYIGKLNDNLVVGYDFEDEAEIAFTPEAYERMGEVLNPNNINESPGTIGQEAYNLVRNASLEFYDNVKPVDENYLEIDHNGQEFQYNVVDKERKEELEHKVIDDTIDQVLSN